MMHWHKLVGVDGPGERCRGYTSGNWRLERKVIRSHVEWELSMYWKDSIGCYIRSHQGWYTRMCDAKAEAERQVALAWSILEGQ